MQWGLMRKATLALFTLVVACGPSHYLLWEVAPPAHHEAGRAAISVVDHREPKKGGDDPSLVGIQRNGLGVPLLVRIGPPQQLSKDLQKLIAAAARSAGVGVTPAGEEARATSRADVAIQSFWCDGYWPEYKGGVVASVTILDPATSVVRVPSQPLQSEAQDGTCRGAFHRALNNVFLKARAMFATPQIHDALIAAAGAPPPPAP